MKLLLLCSIYLFLFSNSVMEGCGPKPIPPECKEGEKLIEEWHPECWDTPKCVPDWWCEDWYDGGDDCPYGSYCSNNRCVCERFAFEVDGECKTSREMCEDNGCHEKADCDWNPDDGISCKCKKGYLGDGINKCDKAPDKCEEVICPPPQPGMCHAPYKAAQYPWDTTHGGCCKKWQCKIDCTQIPAPEEPTCGKNEKIFFEDPAPDAEEAEWCHKKPTCKPKDYCDYWGSTTCMAGAECQSEKCECGSNLVMINYECKPRDKHCQKCDANAKCDWNENVGIMCTCKNGFEGDGRICTRCSEVAKPHTPTCKNDEKIMYFDNPAKCHVTPQCESEFCALDHLPKAGHICADGDRINRVYWGITTSQGCHNKCKVTNGCNFYAQYQGKYSPGCEMCKHMPTKKHDGAKTFKMGCENVNECTFVPKPKEPTCEKGERIEYEEGVDKCHPHPVCKKPTCEANTLPKDNMQCETEDQIKLFKAWSTDNEAECRKHCTDTHGCDYYSFWKSLNFGQCQLCKHKPTTPTECDRAYCTSTGKIGCMDPCDVKNGGCHKRATCESGKDLVAKCTCKKGFEGDGKSCKKSVPTNCKPKPECGEEKKLKIKKRKGKCPKYFCKSVKKFKRRGSKKNSKGGKRKRSKGGKGKRKGRKRADSEFEESVGEASGSMFEYNYFYLFLFMAFSGLAGYYVGNKGTNSKAVPMLETEMAYGAQLNA